MVNKLIHSNTNPIPSTFYSLCVLLSICALVSVCFAFVQGVCICQARRRICCEIHLAIRIPDGLQLNVQPPSIIFSSGFLFRLLFFPPHLLGV